MGEAASQNFLGLPLKKMHPSNIAAKQDLPWMDVFGDGDNDHDVCEVTSSETSIQDSANSAEYSSCSSDLVADATSSSPSSSSSSSSTLLSHANGPLYELSELMAELPIKRGLSKFYQGKSQSYTSLASVKSVEDLAKKGSPYARSKIKSCKSYAGGLNSPKAIITKRASRGSFLSSLGKRGSLMGGCGSSISVQNNL